MEAVTSCLIPATKETFMKNFSRFVRDVEKNGEKFGISDWHYANKRYGKYTGEWYDKFSDELNAEEKSEINNLKIRYITERGKGKFSRFFKEDIVRDLDKINRDVEHYMKKELPRDIDEFSKGAREIGDSAKKVIDDILKERNK